MMVQTICVLGGSGFLGQHLLSQLASPQRILKVITRHPYRHRHLLIIPGVQLIKADIHDSATLNQLFSGVDAVINLVGSFDEGRHPDTRLRHLHVDLVRKIMSACREQRVARLLHVSTLNADASNGPSEYLRTKGEGENLVHTQAGETQTTIFRPSMIFGPQDGFLTEFATLLRFSPVFFVPCPGFRCAPVFAGDVAACMAQALKQRHSAGKRYDLCGPKVYTLAQLVRYTATLTGQRRLIVPLPDGASRLQARLLGILPGKPFSMDRYHTLSLDSLCTSGENTRCSTPLEAIAPKYLGDDSLEGRLNHYRSQR